MKKLAAIILVMLFGCSGNPVDKAPCIDGYKQYESTLSRYYPLTAKEIFQNSDYSYTVTIKDDIFECGYWYDFWLTDRDNKLQMHVDTTINNGKTFGLIMIQSGYCNFEYFVDLSGWTLVVYTNYSGGCK